MPTRDAAPAGAPCWVDLMTSETDRARAFYADVLGWTATDPDHDLGGYFTFQKDGVDVGGCMASQGEGMPDVWSIYLATDDATKTVETAVANGAQVIVAPMVVADHGTMAFLVDPTGAAVGVWQPGAQKGLTVVGETGTPAWFELHTRGYERALDFYREVFRWDTRVLSDTDDFRYRQLVVGDEELAGVMDASAFLPEGVPAHWSVYFAVEDTDRAIARVQELGGAVVQPAEDTPYGRLATVTDPTGAAFKLVAPNDQMPARG